MTRALEGKGCPQPLAGYLSVATAGWNAAPPRTQCKRGKPGRRIHFRGARGGTPICGPQLWRSECDRFSIHTFPFPAWKILEDLFTWLSHDGRIRHPPPKGRGLCSGSFHALGLECILPFSDLTS